MNIIKSNIQSIVTAEAPVDAEGVSNMIREVRVGLRDLGPLGMGIVLPPTPSEYYILMIT